MNMQNELKTYSDVRRLVDDSAFRNSLSYMSWHNRLAMTDLLETWQALVVAMVYEKRAIESYLFPNVKAWLDGRMQPVPQSPEECRALAEELCAHLYPA